MAEAMPDGVYALVAFKVAAIIWWSCVATRWLVRSERRDWARTRAASISASISAATAAQLGSTVLATSQYGPSGHCDKGSTRCLVGGRRRRRQPYDGVEGKQCALD